MRILNDLVVAGTATRFHAVLWAAPRRKRPKLLAGRLSGVVARCSVHASRWPKT